MLTAKPFCSKPPPPLPAIAATSRWISALLVSATGCHHRNLTRVAAGGVSNTFGENTGNANGPGPPGSGSPAVPSDPPAPLATDAPAPKATNKQQTPTRA